jgi:23S rRNA (guanosine2251-2'-O)-methyltransferase
VKQYGEGRLVLGLQPVRECLRVHGQAVFEVALTAGDRRAQGGQHQGALAIAPELVLSSWSEVVLRPDLIAMALDRVQDPQNFGAVVRSAVATGGAALLWGEHASAPLTPATFRASAGAIEHATLCRVPSLKDGLRAALDAGAQVIGLSAGATELLSSIDLRGPTVIVLGNEGDGLQPAVRRCCSRLAALVRPRLVDSLNASVAAAIALYETDKQRQVGLVLSAAAGPEGAGPTALLADPLVPHPGFES